MPVIIIVLFLIIAVEIIFHHCHHKALKTITYRIHVNGTRGKSTVVRLITAGLREGWLCVWGKTTGSKPMLILDDGREEVIKRIGPPNIKEQMKIVKRAARNKVDALVIECMAIRPELGKISEERMIESNIGVITNCRLDHIDVMGTSLDDIAGVLAMTIPRRGILFSGDMEFVKRAEQRAKALSTGVRYVASDAVSEAEIDSFSGFVPREGVALALAVCRECGVPGEVALCGMRKFHEDPGNVSVYRIGSLTLVNAFAANEPCSTEIILDTVLGKKAAAGDLVGLFNHRRDRSYRLKLFSEFMGRRCSRVFLVGDRTRRFGKAFSGKIVNLSGKRTPRAVLDAVMADLGKEDYTLVGMGNYKGMGEALCELFISRGERKWE